MRTLLLVPVLHAALAAQAATALQKRVDEYLQPLVDQGLFRGTVLLARGDEVLVEKGYGLANLAEQRPNMPDTRYKLMSISKTLITAAVMRLVQEGRLALADPVGKHLPGWPAPWSDVTLHDLLDHSSGLPPLELEWREAQVRAGERGFPVWATFASDHQKDPLLARPATEHLYSNFNIEVVGCLVESVSGQSYRDFLRRTLFEPLGLGATGFDDGSTFPELAVGYELDPGGRPVAADQDMSQIQAACGLWSTAGDLHRFARALRDPEWLAADLHRTMVTPRRGDYACSWVRATVHGRTCWRHSGGRDGYRSDFLRFADDDATVIVLGNASFAPIVRISGDLAAILLRKKHPRPVRLDAATRTHCAGVFRSPDGAHLLLHPRGDMLAAFHLEEPSRGHILLPIGRTEFAEPMPADVRLEFERGWRRVRNEIAGKVTVLERVDAPTARWREFAGPLTAIPPLVADVELRIDGDALLLQAGNQPPIEVVPVDDARAIALYGTFEWSWLVRDGDVFRLRIKGIDFRFEPQPR